MTKSCLSDPLDVLENLTLLGPRVLVQKVDRDAGGIILPFDTTRETSWVQILAVSEGCQFFTDDHVGGCSHSPMQHNGIARYGDPAWGFSIITEEAFQSLPDFGVYFEDE